MGLSGVPSSTLRPLTCLIGNTELLCMQCRGIGPHLSASGKSDCFSRVAAEAGVCSRVTGGGDIKIFCLISDVRTPI